MTHRVLLPNKFGDPRLDVRYAVAIPQRLRAGGSNPRFATPATTLAGGLVPYLPANWDIPTIRHSPNRVANIMFFTRLNMNNKENIKWKKNNEKLDEVIALLTEIRDNFAEIKDYVLEVTTKEAEEKIQELS